MPPFKILITGASGFVGKLLAKAEIEKGNAVTGIHDPSESPELDFESKGMDLRDAEGLKDLVHEIKPARVYHLAAVSSVKMCQETPSLCFQVNVLGTLNLLESLTGLRSKPRLLLTSSCEVYGKVDPEDLPVNESVASSPINIYGLSKLTAENLCLFYTKEHGIETVITRGFNHTGPGQESRFVFPYVAKTLARIEKDEEEPVLRMGNLSVKRDVLDARDVVKAYMTVMDKAEQGSIYNITSGRFISIEEGVRLLVEISGLHVNILQETSRMRSYDIPEISGDASRAEKDLGWRAETTLEQTMTDLLAYWRAKEGLL